MQVYQIMEVRLSDCGKWRGTLLSVLYYGHRQSTSLPPTPPSLPFSPMAKNLFSIPIFFIVFRETLEAAIIVSVLLGLAEQIVSRDPNFTAETSGEEDAANNSEPVVDDVVQRRRLLRKMRIQVNSYIFVNMRN